MTASKMLLRVVLFLVFVVLDEQLDGDPDEQQRAAELQEGDLEQRDGDRGECHPQDDGAATPPQDRVLLLARGQIARGQRDDYGVVAGKDDIDHHDLQQSDEKPRFHLSFLVVV